MRIVVETRMVKYWRNAAKPGATGMINSVGESKLQYCIP